ncbi:MAG TPA: hypothetical protein ENI23_00105 [bacterium]|nr:hypothetical protein [bacterium]
MCGIAGAFTYKNAKTDIDNGLVEMINRQLISETLVHMLPRGKDATGVAVSYDDKEWMVLKQPVPAPQMFINDNNFQDRKSQDVRACFQSFSHMWVKNAQTRKTAVRQILGHVRAGTKGSEINPDNNHPLLIGDMNKPDLIFVHNGGIKNDDELFTKHKFNRRGQVDSEIIGHLIASYKDDFSTDNLEKTFKELEGAFAVLAFNPNIPTKTACLKTSSRPMDILWIEELGTLFVVSEKEYLYEAISSYERWRIREGHIKFPYLFPKHKEHMTNGVFILDTEQEIPKDASPKDFIDVTFVTQPVKTKTFPVSQPTSNYDNAYRDNRSASANSKTTVKTSGPIIEDITDYSYNQNVTEAIPLGPGKPEAFTEYDTEGDIAEVTEITAESDCEDWESLVEEGTQMLLSETLDDYGLLISELTEESAQTLILNRCASSIDGSEALSIVNHIYADAFPEGYAVGFQFGKDSAEKDSNIQELTEKLEETEELLRHTDDTMEKVVKLNEKLQQANRALEQKKRSGEAVLRLMKELLEFAAFRAKLISSTGTSDRVLSNWATKATTRNGKIRENDAKMAEKLVRKAFRKYIRQQPAAKTTGL